MSKNVFHKRNRIPDTRLMHPRREWVIGVGITLVMGVVVVSYTAQQFSRYSDTNAFLVESTVSATTYNYGTMQQILTVYDARREALAAASVGRTDLPTANEITDPVAEAEEGDIQDDEILESLEDTEEPIFDSEEGSTVEFEEVAEPQEVRSPDDLFEVE